MIEDEISKVRRNLITFSAAICVVWFLEVPIGPLVRSAAKDIQWTPSLWRVWAVVMLILLYLTARYRFSDEYVAVAYTLQRDFERSHTKYCQSFVYGLVHDVVQGKRRSTEAVGFDVGLAVVKLRDRGVGKDRQIETIRVTSIQENGVKRNSGQVIVQLTGLTARDEPIASQEVTYRYTVTGIAGFRWWIQALWDTGIWSKLAVTNVAPFLLATTAFIIALTGLLSAL